VTEFLSENPGEVLEAAETTVGSVFGVEKRGNVIVWNPRNGDHQWRGANEDPIVAAQVKKEMNEVNGINYISGIDPRQRGLF